MKDDTNLDPIEQNEPIAPSLSSDNAVINPFDQEDNPRRRIIILALSAVGMLGCCVLFAAAFFYFQPDQLSLVKQYFPSATATFTPTPTVPPSITPSPTLPATPTPNMTATAAAQQATDTAVAYQGTAGGGWAKRQVVLKNTFYSNKKTLYIQNADHDYSQNFSENLNGKNNSAGTAPQ